MIANDNQAPAQSAPFREVRIIGVVGEGGRVTLFGPLPRPVSAAGEAPSTKGRGHDAERR